MRIVAMALRGLVLCGAFSLGTAACSGNAGGVSGPLICTGTLVCFSDAACGAIDASGPPPCSIDKVGLDAGESDTVSCVSSPAECTKASLSQADEIGFLKQSCTSGGGTVVPECPSANLIGCCTDFTGESLSETCYYASGGSPGTQADCKAVGGTWSTTR